MVSMTSFLTLFCSMCVLEVLSSSGHNNSSLLSRKRRYLNFPNKANLIVSFTLLKPIANDVTWFPTTKVVTIHEIDILFPLPHDPSPFELGQTALGQPPVFKQPATSRADRHRRDLYAQLEDIFDMQGLEGRSCLLRAICEATDLRQSTEENLLNELLSVIFKMPESSSVSEEYSVSPQFCDQHFKRCPVSLFDLARRWGHIFSDKYLSVTKHELRASLVTV